MEEIPGELSNIVLMSKSAKKAYIKDGVLPFFPCRNWIIEVVKCFGLVNFIFCAFIVLVERARILDFFFQEDPLSSF